ncbi:hypothetical protein GGX14DRAFT_387667 [Mycena pura]|uniref:Uncharacterized protein n=1 Tax=Mycena pura TaxID=153505 RepID=A0AAD7E1Y2_9AGAR|nr:hypothetical protein GGX14DRAFT_387667 [Mycena pura]
MCITGSVPSRADLTQLTSNLLALTSGTREQCTVLCYHQPQPADFNHLRGGFSTGSNGDSIEKPMRISLAGDLRRRMDAPDRRCLRNTPDHWRVWYKINRPSSSYSTQKPRPFDRDTTQLPTSVLRMIHVAQNVGLRNSISCRGIASTAGSGPESQQPQAPTWIRSHDIGVVESAKGAETLSGSGDPCQMKRATYVSWTLIPLGLNLKSGRAPPDPTSDQFTPPVALGSDFPINRI